MNKKILVIFLESFFISWAFMQAMRLSPKHLLTAVLFFLSFFFLFSLQKKAEQTACSASYLKTASLLSAIFTFFYLFGDFEGLTGELSNHFFKAFTLTACAIGFFSFFQKVIFFFLLLRKGHCLSCDNTETFCNRCSKAKFFLGSFLLCFIGWTPYLLKGFPGIITVDSTHQYAQILHIYEQSNHHPWIHTQLIRLFYRIGLLFTEDVSVAIGFYTVFQMLFMASCVAFLMVFLQRYRLKTWVYAAVLGFYALVPYNGAFAISMIKDTPFAGFVMLYTLSIFMLLEETNGKLQHSKKSVYAAILYVFSGIGFCLFRSNGFYAFLFMMPFVIFVFRKNYKKIVVLQLLVLTAVILYKGPVLDAFDVKSPDLVEHLSIPGQQISRVLINDRELSQEQSSFLNRIMDTGRMSEGYTPYVSDWFKRLVRMGDQTYLEEHFKEFIKIYIELGIKYPGDYLLAFRDQTFGYWFPFLEREIISGNEGVTENEFGLENRAVLKGPIVVKINEILFKLQDVVPLYGILWSMGALFWLILICMGLVFVNGDRRHLLLFLPAVGIFLTLLVATPVADDFRYAYGYVFLTPLYFVISGLPVKSP